MSRRKALDIKKDILRILRNEGELSLRELDIKVNTNYRTIRDQVKELEFFKFIEVIHQDRNPATGRPSTSVKLRRKGEELI